MKALVVSVVLCLLAACSSRASVAIEEAWARATPPGSTVGSVYAVLESTVADELVSVSTPLADRVEMHATSEAGGTMQMRPVASVPLPANDAVKFAAGGLHLMLIGLHEPLAAGSTLPLTFNFRSANAVTVEAKILAPDDTPAH
jgi:hypothetical protein